MEGITEVFTSFLPTTTVVTAKDDGTNEYKKKFSAGGLLALIVYLFIGAGIGAVI